MAAADDAGPGTKAGNLGEQFPPEQLRAIELVARGWTDERIAREMSISRSTLQRLLHRSERTLGARSRVTLIVRALQRGLIALPPIDADDTDPEAGS